MVVLTLSEGRLWHSVSNTDVMVPGFARRIPMSTSSLSVISQLWQGPRHSSAASTSHTPIRSCRTATGWFYTKLIVTNYFCLKQKYNLVLVFASNKNTTSDMVIPILLWRKLRHNTQRRTTKPSGATSQAKGRPSGPYGQNDELLKAPKMPLVK